MCVKLSYGDLNFSLCPPPPPPNTPQELSTYEVTIVSRVRGGYYINDL